MILTLSNLETLVIAIFVLFIGRYITNNVNFLKRYNIPIPVTGGILISIFIGIAYVVASVEINFDTVLGDILLLSFFSTIGLSARLSLLIAGGRLVAILSIIIVLFLIMQNAIGIFGAYLTNIDPLIGLLTGSVTLSGGHGTGITYAKIFSDEFGLNNALEIALACATFGLVMGGLLGGPFARFLIKRFHLKTETEPVTLKARSRTIHHEEVIDYRGVLEVIALISLCIIIGTNLNVYFNSLGLSLPDFVPCLFAGIIFANIADFSKLFVIKARSLTLFSNLSLDIFLTIALMRLQLWTLVELAGPLLLILVVQVFAVLLFTYFIVFRMVRKNYTGSVISAGYLGFGLGAMPTAIANMSTVTKRYGPSPNAFIVIPLIGAFLIDIANAIVIQLFLFLPMFEL
ncbi:MAG: sodium/glutamate symporter [Gammaproteobacteria bacterium]